MGDLSLNGFYIDEHEIGDLLVQTNWDAESRGVSLQGELDVNNIQTFNFSGSYMLERILLMFTWILMILTSHL